MEALQPIHSIQKLLESGEPLLHRMSHIVGVNLQSEITKYSDSFTLGSEITSVMNEHAFSSSIQAVAFGQRLSGKWQSIMSLT